MTTILMTTSGPDDWKRFLAKSEEHWKTGNSAKALAYCWEENGDIPQDAGSVLNKTSELPRIETLIRIPEYQVPLPGGSRLSQTDVWVLAKT